MNTTIIASAKRTQPFNMPVSTYTLESVKHEAIINAFNDLYERGVLDLKIGMEENNGMMDVVVSIMENRL